MFMSYRRIGYCATFVDSYPISVLTMGIIRITECTFPELATYTGYVTDIWTRRRLTNNGPLVQELEAQLSETLGGPAVELVTNGTVAIELAIRALELRGEIITTPFSYVATTTAVLWQGCTPVFVDIDPNSLCLDPHLIEAAITPRTCAILATHVYGYPCDVVAIEDIARRHGLKVIYDAAHAFGATLYGRSLLTFGDLTACSFHATKLFHTSEGGAVITHDAKLAERVGQLKSFGYADKAQGEHLFAGTNGKMSELHAAMGLSLLPGVATIIERRAVLHARYRRALAGLPLAYPVLAPGVGYNYAYYPVIFESSAQLLAVQAALLAGEVESRRYFFPALNQLACVAGQSCPVTEDIAPRILCLPLYQQLTEAQVSYIAGLVRAALRPFSSPETSPASYATTCAA